MKKFDYEMQIYDVLLRAGEGIRTPDLLITNQLLYQLSYASVPKYYH